MFIIIIYLLKKDNGPYWKGSCGTHEFTVYNIIVVTILVL